MRRVATVGTAEPLGPARLLQCGLALSLAAEWFKKRGRRQARLELDANHGHDTIFLNGFPASMRLPWGENGAG